LYKLGNLANLSDILRLVILYQDGGIDIDCDNTFKGQHRKYNIKYSKNPNQYNIYAKCKFSLYSFHDIGGNSVLVDNSGAQGWGAIL
ncbi:glycosyltransferase, partial [Francisella tularensis]|uniref:glycosyltransferase n=1 Tax=Francisella tularensis TaxID=263 RepID=UPI002381AC77